MNQLTLVQKQAKFLLDMGRLVQYATNICKFQCTCGEVERTQYQQTEDFRLGLSQIKTGGTHMSRCAVDMYFYNPNLITDPKVLEPLKDFWLQLDPVNDCGLRWGWDLNHFERRQINGVQQ